MRVRPSWFQTTGEVVLKGSLVNVEESIATARVERASVTVQVEAFVQKRLEQKRESLKRRTENELPMRTALSVSYRLGLYFSD
jgi:hypothetical protein